METVTKDTPFMIRDDPNENKKQKAESFLMIQRGWG